MYEDKKLFLSLDAYEKRVETILALENRGEIVGEFINGPNGCLKILRNHFKPNKSLLVLLIHGSGMNEFSWASAIERLEEKGINAVTFAWHGHSRSIPFDRERFSKSGLMDFIADAEAVIKKYQSELKLKDDQIVLVGHSYGVIINTYLARNKNYKSILNFCNAYPNEEYFNNVGVNIQNQEELMNAMSKLYNFASKEWIRKTLDDANRNIIYENYKQMGTQNWYLSQLLNIKIPDNYSGLLEKILGPSSRKAAAEAFLIPPFLPKKSEINSKIYFFAAAEDRLDPKNTIEQLTKAWDGSYKELPGPHAGTYSPYLDQYIDTICELIS